MSDPVRAYTVGNPDTYDPALALGEVWKQVGGAVYATLAEAAAALEDGKLPAIWYSEGLPGAVYELELTAPLEDVSYPVGLSMENQRWLTKPMRIRKRVEVPPEPPAPPTREELLEHVKELEGYVHHLLEEGRLYGPDGYTFPDGAHFERPGE